MVDISKIQPGDKVTIEVEVYRNTPRGHLVFNLEKSRNSGNERALDPQSPLWYNKAGFTIVGHTPALYVPKVGDIIKHISQSRWSSEILFIDRDGDWLVFTNYGSKHTIHKGSQKYYELAQSD